MFRLSRQETQELITHCDRFTTLKHSAVTPIAKVAGFLLTTCRNDNIRKNRLALNKTLPSGMTFFIV